MRCAPSPFRVSILRAIAAAVPALAILLQVLVTAPLLLRMTDAAWNGDAPICIADTGRAPAAGHDAPLPAAHDHAHCVLCQANLLAPGVGTVAPPPPTATLFAADPPSRLTAAPHPRRRFETYASRAPPETV